MNLHIKSNKVKAHPLLLCHGVPGVGNGSFVTRALDSVTGEADSFGSPQNHVVGIALLGSLPITNKSLRSTNFVIHPHLKSLSV